MQALLELLPLAAFIVAYWAAGLKVAIAVLMAAMVLLVGVTWLTKGQVAKTLLFSTALVLVLGAVSLAIDNPIFFKWKPTVLNWGLAIAFGVSQVVGSEPLVQRLFTSLPGGSVRLGPSDWRRLNAMWVAFFMVSGAANIIVAYRYPEAVWVNFKVFGLLGLTALFMGLMLWWLARRGALADGDPPTES